MAKFLILIGIGFISAGFAAHFIFSNVNPSLYNTAEELPEQLSNNELINIAAAITPHHSLAEELIAEVFIEVAKVEPEVVVLISPDHWGMAETFFVTSDVAELRGNDVDHNLMNKLIKAMPNSVSIDNKLIEHEHGITVVAAQASKYLKNTKIIPIAISGLSDKESLNRFIIELSKMVPDKTVVVSSTDFSHYLPLSAAQFHDVTSLSALESLNVDFYQNLELDCWQCLYVATRFSQERGYNNFNLLNKSNSALLVNSPEVDETTSYITGVFSKIENKEISDLTTLLLIGDVMLGRHVEKLMNDNGAAYPFKKISRLFWGVDETVVNLEGPLVENHKITPTNSVQFSFDASVASLLAKHKITVASLANNHTDDFGLPASKFTNEALNKRGIKTIGNPNDINNNSKGLIGKDKVLFFSFDASENNFDADEAVKFVQINISNTDKFALVYIHWGTEYSHLANQRQRDLAHKFIDVGVDAIVGHHPHVVQDLELYKGRVIFYSLGNFIFDQYWNEDTEQGLVLGLELDKENVQYSLFPISSRLAQPELMIGPSKNNFLEDLAKRSSSVLSQDIKDGIISLSY